MDLQGLLGQLQERLREIEEAIATFETLARIRSARESSEPKKRPGRPRKHPISPAETRSDWPGERAVHH